MQGEPEMQLPEDMDLDTDPGLGAEDDEAAPDAEAAADEAAQAEEVEGEEPQDPAEAQPSPGGLEEDERQAEQDHTPPGSPQQAAPGDVMDEDQADTTDIAQEHQGQLLPGSSRTSTKGDEPPATCCSMPLRCVTAAFGASGAACRLVLFAARHGAPSVPTAFEDAQQQQLPEAAMQASETSRAGPAQQAGAAQAAAAPPMPASEQVRLPVEEMPMLTSDAALPQNGWMGAQAWLSWSLCCSVPRAQGLPALDLAIWHTYGRVLQEYPGDSGEQQAAEAQAGTALQPHMAAGQSAGQQGQMLAAPEQGTQAHEEPARRGCTNPLRSLGELQPARQFCESHACQSHHAEDKHLAVWLQGPPRFACCLWIRQRGHAAQLSTALQANGLQTVVNRGWHGR